MAMEKIVRGRIVRAVRLLAAAALAMTAWPGAASAQTPPVVIDIAPPPAFPSEFALPATRPVAKAATESWLTVNGVPVLRNVTTATLTPFFPATDRANGTAIIIAPGGAFTLLAMDNEGFAVARWLQSKGIAAFVLKYRLRPTRPGAAGLSLDIADFGRMMAKAPGTESVALATARAMDLAVDDAGEAVKAVKLSAARWHIDPDRVGVMGFSAGAIAGANLALRAPVEARPAFLASLYGDLKTPAVPVPEHLPPLWAAMASDDPLFGNSDFGLLRAWTSKGGAVEFHQFNHGGHGFGYSGLAGTTSVHWRDEFLWWLESRGLLARPAL